MKLNCLYFENNQCQSCKGLGTSLALWREQEHQRLEAILPAKWSEAFWSPQAFGSRTKAKLAVAGPVNAPIVGRMTSEGVVVELSQCSLHHQKIRESLDLIKGWITKYNLVPYDVASKRGELKYIILQMGDREQLMLRFVMRSMEAFERVKKLAEEECAKERFSVISMNIQPKASAIIEGPEELIVSQEKYLPITMGEAQLLLGPKSFVQTNQQVASALYLEARRWLKNRPGRVLDLFCGVGGFAAHLLEREREVVGIEISTEAITAAKLAIPQATFHAMDAWEYLKSDNAFDIVVVNPPRRGLGEDICQRLNDLNAKTLLYSSCNPETLKTDLALLNYKIEKIKAFEMFPLTEHWEVLCLLTRK